MSMNIVAEKKVDRVGTVLLTDYNGSYRVLISFNTDPGYYHDGAAAQTLFGQGTRISEADATPVSHQYALTVFRQACAFL